MGTAWSSAAPSASPPPPQRLSVGHCAGWGKKATSAGAMWLLNRPAAYSIEKAQKMLGYQPVVSIDEGMACVEHWLRSEGLFDRSNKSGWIEPIRLADNASHWSLPLV